MDSLLTPTTALFYSTILEPSMFDPPSASQNAAALEADVFGNAFEVHNLSKSEAQGKYDGAQHFSKNLTLEAARCYESPPDSYARSSRSQVTRNISVEEEQMQYSATSLRAQLSPRSPEGQDLLASVPDYYNNAGQTFHHTIDAPVIEPKKKTRTRKRKQLGEEEKAIKHAAFLERNRLAADKCRKRKKANNEGLEEECKVLKLRNTVLRDIKGDLMMEIRGLREMIGGNGLNGENNEVLEMGQVEEEGEDMFKQEHDWAMNDNNEFKEDDVRSESYYEALS